MSPTVHCFWRTSRAFRQLNPVLVVVQNFHRIQVWNHDPISQVKGFGYCFRPAWHKPVLDHLLTAKKCRFTFA
jgi:hypothetical protein